MGYNDREELNEVAVHRLQELSLFLESDPEMIEAMSLDQVKSEIAEMGLDPNKSLSIAPRSADDLHGSGVAPFMLASSVGSPSISGSTLRGSFEVATSCQQNEFSVDAASSHGPMGINERLKATSLGSQLESLANEQSRLNDEAREFRLDRFNRQIQHAQARYIQYQREYDIVTCKSHFITSEFASLAVLHNRELPALGEFLTRHEGDTEKARYYFVSAILSMAFAIVFAITVLIPSSKFLVIAACTLIAISLVSMFGAILRLLTGANPENPDGIPKLKFAVVMFGGIFFILLAAFVSLRFANLQRPGIVLAVVMVGLELSAIALAGGFECFSRIYSWSSDLDKRIHRLLRRKTELEFKIKQEESTLEDLQARLGSGKVHIRDQLIDFALPTSDPIVHGKTVGYP